MCRKRLLPFPSTAGARSARLPTRHSARRAVARSGPAARSTLMPPPRRSPPGAVAPSGPLRSPVRRPFEIAPRRPAVPPATSWPDLPGLVPGIRPSIGPRTREEALAEGDARNKSGHDEEGGPVGWIASPSMQTATAHSPSPPPRDKKWLAERAGERWGKLFTNRSGASCARALGRAARSRALRTCGSAHFPLSPLRPLGPEKEKGADTAFGPPPPFSGEGNRGSWAGLPSGPAFEGYEREEARAGYRRYDPPGASRRGPSLTQRTMADAGACSADVSYLVHK